MTIGLVGYNCNNGLGELNRQAVRYCDKITKWRIKPHRTLDHVPPERTIDVSVSASGVPASFFSGIDTVLIFETEFYAGMVHAAKKAGKRVVCVPMLEWTPMWQTRTDPKAWIGDVDLFICPTRQCFDLMHADGFPCVYFPWPFDMERFQYRERTYCKRFLFVEGNGGYNGRKGVDTMKRAKELWPDMPLVVYSLMTDAAKKWPAKTEVIAGSFTDNRNVYDQGDVLIYPATCDGIGLQPFEAMSQGMPVISTDGQPWNENDAIARIRSTVDMRPSGKGRVIPWHVADAEHLVEICKGMAGKFIGNESQLAFEYARERAWPKRADEFTRLVISGKAV